MKIDHIFVRFFIFFLFSLLANNIYSYDDDIECFDTGMCIAHPKSIVPRGVNVAGKPPEIDSNEKVNCNDRHLQCKSFANDGHCVHSPGWMIVNCPKSCDACHLREHSIRCKRERLNISSIPAIQPNQLNSYLDSLEEDLFNDYDVTYLHRDPHIIQIEDFITKDEARKLLSNVNDEWEIPTDSGVMNEYGETGLMPTQSRSGGTFWCMNECFNDETVMEVTSRISNSLSLESGNFEAFQFVKYDEGQGHTALHDYGTQQSDLPSGPRIITVFIFLSDFIIDDDENINESSRNSGSLYFPIPNIQISPKIGRAIIWPNVLNEDPNQVDTRTIHETLPVAQGAQASSNTINNNKNNYYNRKKHKRKGKDSSSGGSSGGSSLYGVQRWAHLYDYLIANKWGCTGSFQSLH